MANKTEKTPEELSEELSTWISSIPFSKPKKNLTRDFSDAVLMAEVLKVYYPRYVDLHNYVAASSLTTKKENWNTLNRKVFSKIDMKLSKDTINQLANSLPGAVEHLLLEVKNKILKGVEQQSPQNSPSDKDKESVEEGTINETTKSTVGNGTLPSTEQTVSATSNPDRSVVLRAKDRFFLVLWWIMSWLCIWNHLPNLMCRSSKNLQGANASRAHCSSEDINEDAVPRHVCTQLRQELREKDDIICTLNHKVTYLESAVKLKELRISNMTAQILQNAVESDQLVKTPMITDAKSRLRTLNLREKLKTEE